MCVSISKRSPERLAAAVKPTPPLSLRPWDMRTPDDTEEVVLAKEQQVPLHAHFELTADAYRITTLFT